MGDMSLIGPDTQKLLSDGKNDVRKRGAHEIDRKVQELSANGDLSSIHRLIKQLTSNFIHSVQTSYRKGGLLAITAVAIALGQANIGDFVFELVDAALELFQDQDPQVRYHAAESLYNIAKVARGLLLVKFSDIFNGMCNLKVDNDRTVQNASDTLDGILRDIATESKEFNIDLFVRTIRNHVVSTKPRIRQYVLTWLILLDNVPSVNLAERGHLPQFLGGVFEMLSDSDRKISGLADKVLSAYLDRVRNMVSDHKEVNWTMFASIVIEACKSKDEKTRGTALTWVIEMLLLSQYRMVPFMPDMLKVVITCIADREEHIRKKASDANDHLASLWQAARELPEHEKEARDVLASIFDTLTVSLNSGEDQTKCSALEWYRMVLDKNPDLIETSFERLLPELLELLGDSSDEVVVLSLRVLALLTHGNSGSFHRFLSELVALLQADGFKHMQRGGFIIKALAKITPPDALFSSLAGILITVQDLGFVSSLVTNLNMILLTSPDLLPLRNILKKGLHDDKARELFTELYYCWAYNAVSLLSLCLLSRAYEHSYTLVREFGDMEVTVSMLVQLDKLIQILESPVFTFLRLALLEPEENPFLIKTLFGVLMLLPQSSAFDELHKRLKSVNTLCNLNHRVQKRGAKDTEHQGMEWYAASGSVRMQRTCTHRDTLLVHYKSVEKDKEHFVKFGHPIVHTNA